ncbi:Stp1/IreP family PP2C-type Ser/Thr phosphatase [Egibacter rhizosphaerae]|uniref:Stp1/IreP family PP2C-type Ser/Thr phosphatase n=1 Tax=Egibacter rhizosphaerae TaxID=1670831 RepID=A0A411YFF9_9ACTN|nr:Stp1/IreP family PP2C-type Ser/Thr phosphatase [Egibacter rhizosphaerae]QBI19983.1 Stp1/IreP family PP2C-type Ser/Thr phosphatase [Egibacter rhizosphaerae]
MQIEAHGQSDIGQVRAGNEDDYFVGRTVFAVADGMGGHVAGEVAAQTALEPIAALDQREFASDDEAEEALAEALQEANRQVVEKAEAEPSYRGMGTTLTAALWREDRLHVAHVGDSRAYLLRGQEPITQLTTDHTLVERLIREGRLTREEAETHPQRNVITRAIGNEVEVIVDTLPPLHLEDGDQILLCSDGLTGPVHDAEIAGALEGLSDAREAVATLIQRANEAGGPDNITVVLLRAHGTPDGSAAPVAASAVGDTSDPDATDTGTALATHGVDASTDTARMPVRQISTRTESGSDWASSMGRLGAPQGRGQRATGDIDSRKARSGRRGRVGVVGAWILGIIVLAAVIGGGAWLFIGTSYFVSDHEGEVAIFQGVDTEIAGQPLFRVVEDEDSERVPMDALPAWRQREVEAGLHARDLADARDILANLETERVDGDDGDDEAGDDADDGADDTQEGDDANADTRHVVFGTSSLDATARPSRIEQP